MKPAATAHSGMRDGADSPAASLDRQEDAAGYVAVWNLTRRTLLASRAVQAKSFSARLFGLLFRPPLEADQALLIEPCAAIHTLGMRYPIDVLFTDRTGRIIGLSERLRPNRLYAGAWRARRTIELPAGAIAASRTQVGDILGFDGR